jgi:hypothetical protein
VAGGCPKEAPLSEGRIRWDVELQQEVPKDPFPSVPTSNVQSSVVNRSPQVLGMMGAGPQPTITIG